MKTKSDQQVCLVGYACWFFSLIFLFIWNISVPEYTVMWVTFAVILSGLGFYFSVYKRIPLKRLWKAIEWNIDYYLVFFLYNENKLHRYHEWMSKKWGEKYQ